MYNGNFAEDKEKYKMKRNVYVVMVILLLSAVQSRAQSNGSTTKQPQKEVVVFRPVATKHGSKLSSRIPILRISGFMEGCILSLGKEHAGDTVFLFSSGGIQIYRGEVNARGCVDVHGVTTGEVEIQLVCGEVIYCGIAEL